MDRLDEQMATWRERLVADVGVAVPESARLASLIATQVSGLSPEAKRRVNEASPVPVRSRLDELVAFQSFMDLIRPLPLTPGMNRAQVITQNYLCFAYLGEACFTVLLKELPPGSCSKKCCAFLTNNPVRAFRNAIAHANWHYLPDFSGIEYWARKGSDRHEPLSRFLVSQEDLQFWQALSRCVAYASYLNL